MGWLRLEVRSPWPALALGLAIALVVPGASAGASGRPASGGSQTAGSQAAGEASGTLLVRFRSGTGRSAASAAVGQHGARVEKAAGNTGFSVVSTGGRPVEEVRRELEASPLVAAVEENRIRRASVLPDDPAYADWQASYLAAVGLPEAWDHVTGSDGLVVAVLDSGVDLDHPDLVGRLLPGWDVVNNDPEPADDAGHGTMVAGIAAARTNNRAGVAGATWGGSILPVKVLAADGSASDADIAAGITWAVDHGADVINLSLGGPGSSATLQAAVDYALARDVVVVAAAGNDATSEPYYPAACRGVVAVGATDSAGRLASFSNHGSWVDLTAPGVSITSTVAGPGERYGQGSGTSFATPLVAGAALLLRAADPAARQAVVVDRLLRSARDLGALGVDPLYGAGLLDAAAALRLPPPAGSGYWMLGSEGRVYNFGGARYLGEAGGLVAGAADLEPTPSGEGYWVVDGAGRVFPRGDALSWGSVVAGRLWPGEVVTSLSATPNGRGYWIFTTSGRAFAFGDAVFLGDMGAVRLNGPVLDSIPTPSGEGYYMVASDGGIFTFGDARFAGSMGGWPLNAPVQSLVPDPDGSGYWLVASDGGIFAFDAPFRGSMGSVPLNAPVTGMVAFGNGYLMVATDGGVFNFSDRPFSGSLGSAPPAHPIVAVAARSG